MGGLISSSVVVSANNDSDAKTQDLSQPVLAVGIVGGGIAGLSLAAILSNQQGTHVTVLERGAPGRDQGYGLDIDDEAQDALKMAGLYQHFWEISRKGSDVLKLYVPNTIVPFWVGFRPFWYKYWEMLTWKKPREPETNRTDLRNMFCNALETRASAEIYHSVSVSSLRQTNEGKIQCIGPTDEVVGTYDIVVDASGVHSHLRHNAVEDPKGVHPAGHVLMHGVINNPEESCPEGVVKQLQGSIMIMAKGYFYALQRFGAAASDRRSAFFYLVPKASQTQIFNEIGLKPSQSRVDGIIKDKESLAKIKAWIHNDMGNHFARPYHDTVDALDRITIRDEFTHSSETMVRSNPAFPHFICIGDALRNLGLGGGGNEALTDALDLARVLVKRSKAQDPLDGLGDELHKLQLEMLERKHKFNRLQDTRKGFLLARPPPGKPATASLEEMAPVFFTEYPWEPLPSLKKMFPNLMPDYPRVIRWVASFAVWHYFRQHPDAKVTADDQY